MLTVRVQRLHGSEASRKKYWVINNDKQRIKNVVFFSNWRSSSNFFHEKGKLFIYSIFKVRIREDKTARAPSVRIKCQMAVLLSNIHFICNRSRHDVQGVPKVR